MERIEFNGKTTIFTMDPSFLKKNIIGGRSLLVYQNGISEMVLRFKKENWLDSELFSIDDGEYGKNLQTVKSIISYLIKRKFTRTDYLIGMGGGAVSDVAGFVASIFKRGMRFALVPTTLLSMVDSSLGGKNGVNFKGSKNQVGTVYQPDIIYYDLSFIKSLPQDQYKSGLGEIIKYGVSLNRNLYNFMRGHKEEISKRELSVMEDVVNASQEIKMSIVKMDVTEEEGIREVLNVGHTVGHAIESSGNFSLPHGIAIANGILIECNISKFLGLTDPEVCQRIREILNDFNIPEISPLGKRRLFSFILNDKKIRNGNINFPVIREIGKTEVLKINLRSLKEVIYNYEIWTCR